MSSHQEKDKARTDQWNEAGSDENRLKGIVVNNSADQKRGDDGTNASPCQAHPSHGCHRTARIDVRRQCKQHGRPGRIGETRYRKE